MSTLNILTEASTSENTKQLLYSSRQRSRKQMELRYSFPGYILKSKQNKIILFIIVGLILTQFVIFKYFYPFASYIHGDSFNYLDTAYKNLSINTYMIGYPMFLRIFSVFTTSDYALTAFQFLFLEGSAMFLLFTLHYFYSFSNLLLIILLSFVVFNPLFLYLGNLISSDALFTSLSMIWFALLLWIVHEIKPKILIFHAIVIFLAFTVRYNALIYLLIATPAFFLSKYSLKQKLVGYALGTMLIAAFVIHTANQYKQLTGYWQYSPFAGWQMANNAMYAYRYVDSSKRKPVPARFRNLDNMIRTHFDSTRDIKKHPTETVLASTFYMWTPRLPLFKYRNMLFNNPHDSNASEFKKWATMGPLYKDYGYYIITHYPSYFAQYFLWPNGLKYYAPPVEFLNHFNSNTDKVAEIAKVWFGYKNLSVFTRTRTRKMNMVNYFPILSGMINVVMLFGLLSFLLLKGFMENSQLGKGLFMGTILWLLNAGFTIFASSAALRFQSFPITVTTFISGIIFDWLIKRATQEKRITKSLVPRTSVGLAP